MRSRSSTHGTRVDGRVILVLVGLHSPTDVPPSCATLRRSRNSLATRTMLVRVIPPFITLLYFLLFIITVTYFESEFHLRTLHHAGFVRSFHPFGDETNAAMDFFEEYGFVVFRDVVSPEQCTATVGGTSSILSLLLHLLCIKISMSLSTDFSELICPMVHVSGTPPLFISIIPFIVSHNYYGSESECTEYPFFRSHRWTRSSVTSRLLMKGSTAATR